MTYKEALFFIGKCLTINFEKHNKVLVENDLKSNIIDWDIIVKVSTNHFVFPALYCSLKKVAFLHYLPEDLVAYMQHITDLNRERNQQIILQAKELNEFLLENNITPIFLKGTGNLLEGLYDDIAERMVGDIDFLVAKEDGEKAYQLLNEIEYNKVGELFEDHRHFPRLIHLKKIAAVEVHKEMLRKEESTFFNFKNIINSVINVKGINFLSIKNQIKLTILSKFINDDAYQLKSVSLRPAYDLFLLDKKEKYSFEGENLSKELLAGMSVYFKVLNIKNDFLFNKTTIQYSEDVFTSLGESKKAKKTYLFLKNRFKILVKATTNKSYFKFVTSRLLDRNWYKRRFGI